MLEKDGQQNQSYLLAFHGPLNHVDQCHSLPFTNKPKEVVLENLLALNSLSCLFMLIV